jgi:hypothetical protein
MLSHPLRIDDDLGTCETLSLCLQALLATREIEVSYAELNAALGLSFLIAVDVKGGGPLDWLSLARDTRLAEGADIYGLRVRDMHPAAAAAGVDGLPEFGQHFVDSYIPLIRRALEHDQPVLARGGWPAGRSYEWGVITSVSTEGIGLAGFVTGATAAVPLVGPAAQCHVVEAVTPRRPDPEGLFRMALRSAIGFLRGDTGGRPGVVAGPRAYEAWYQRLIEDVASAGMADPSIEAHVVVIRSLVTNREAGALFFGHQRDRLVGAAAERSREVVAEFEATIDALQALRVLLAGMPEAKTGDNEAALGRAFQQAAQADERLRESIEAVAAAAGAE